MKIFAPLFIVAVLLCLVGAEPVSLPLKDGSVIKGEVTSVTSSEVVVSTEFGIATNHGSKLNCGYWLRHVRGNTYCAIRTIRVLKNRFGSVPV